MSIRIVLPTTTILFMMTGGALAQTPPSAADGPWSGQVQCVLSARGPNPNGMYRDDQTHTWRITGGPPGMSGMFRQWPAVWSVEGRGANTTANVQWETNVPETSAPIAIWEAGGKIRFGSQHGLLVANGAMTLYNTVSKQQSTLSLQEWDFPAIEDAATATTVTGMRSRTTPYSRGPRQPSGIMTVETCAWNFTRGNAPTTDTGRRAAPPDLISRNAAPPTTVLPPPPPLNSGGPNTPPPGVAFPPNPATTPPPTVTANAAPVQLPVPPPTVTANAAPVQLPAPPPTVTANAAPVQLPAPAPTGGASPGASNTPVPRGPLAAALRGKTGPTDAPPADVKPTSGTYLVTVTGLIAAKATENLIPVNTDGKGDEIYAAAVVRRYDRRSSQAVESASLQTSVYGDTNNASGREPAGTMSVLGGIQSGDKIPKDMSATRLAAPQASIFPWRLWEGTLTDGVDALVISPSIWEWDDGKRVLAQWIESQNSLTGSMLARRRLLDQINGARFGTLYLDPIQSASGSVNAVDFVGGIVAVGLLGIPVFSTGTGIFDGTFDRPFGLIPNGIGSMAVDNPAVVLTREIIEASLNNANFAKTIPVPNTTVILIVPKPGVMLIGFTDGDIASNGTLFEQRGAYYMVLQVERL